MLRGLLNFQKIQETLIRKTYTPKRIREFGKVAGCKVNIQNSMTSIPAMYMTNENEIKCPIHKLENAKE